MRINQGVLIGFFFILSGLLSSCALSGTPTPANAAITAAVVMTATPPSVGGASGDARVGLARFVTAGCGVCHAYNGLQADLGPSLKGVTTRRSDAYITANIRSGRNRMPPFSPARVTDQDILDILAYVHTLQ